MSASEFDKYTVEIFKRSSKSAKGGLDRQPILSEYSKESSIEVFVIPKSQDLYDFIEDSYPDAAYVHVLDFQRLHGASNSNIITDSRK